MTKMVLSLRSEARIRFANLTETEPMEAVRRPMHERLRTALDTARAF